MPFSVSTLQGFKHYRTIGPREFFFVPGNPGTTYTRGNQAFITATEGVLTEATDGDTFAPYTVEKTVVCPAASQAFPIPADFVPPKYGLTETSKTLVLVSVSVPAGTAVRKGKIANYQDETVVSYTAATRAVELTTGFAADNRPNGALAYIYEGPGAGEMNIIESYDHTGGAAELLAVFHRAWNATLTTATKMIILGETTAVNPLSFFGRMDLKDGDELDVNDGYDDGDFMLMGGWRDVPQHLAQGWLPFCNAGALYI